MKFVLLMTLTVALVYSQQVPYSLHPKFIDSMMFGPLRSYSAFYPSFFLPGSKALVRNPYGFYDLTSEHNEGEIDGRLNAANDQYLATPQNVPMQRFLFNAGNSGTGTQPVASLLFRTSIATTVVTTTIPSLSLCIPSAQFSAGAAATKCARRRREIAQVLDEFVQFNDEENQTPKVVQPSPIESMATTSSALPTPEVTASSDYHGILSSKSDNEGSEKSEDAAKRLKRFFNLLVTTTTITSYSFATTVVPKQVSVIRADATCVAANQASCLVCIPPGYGIC